MSSYDAPPSQLFPAAEGNIVPLIANRFSYFLRREKNLHYWRITTGPLQTVQPLDIGALQCATDHLVDYHDGLRLRLHAIGSNWQQEIVEPHLTKPLISLSSINSLRDDSFVEFVNRSIELVCGGFTFPGDLFKILSLQSGDGSAVLFIAAHHLIVDGYAFSVMLHDFFDLYRQYCRGARASLPPKTTLLKDYSYASTSHWRGQADEEADYWESLPWDCIQPISTDYAEHRDSHCEKYTVSCVKSVPLHDLLVALSRNQPEIRTFADVLLAAIGRAYYKWVGHPVLLLAMVFTGRESFAPGIDLSRTVGWLSETVPLFIQATLPLDELLDDIHQQTDRAGLRGKSYGVLRYLSDDLPQCHRIRQHPYPGISLNLKVPRFLKSSYEDLARPFYDYDLAENLDDTRRVYYISGGALFRDRRFVLSWDFSAALFDMKTIEAFTDNCIRELMSMVHQ